VDIDHQLLDMLPVFGIFVAAATRRSSMSAIDKQRIAAVKKLEQLGYTFAGATANTVEPIVAAAKLNIARFMQPAKNGLPQRALINSGLNVKGNLETDGELHIDGQIVGNVSCGHLVIGKDGAVRGDIKADEVVICGKTEGLIRARRIMLQESARVVGDIFYEIMSMEEGAQFIGASNRGKDEAMAQVCENVS